MQLQILKLIAIAAATLAMIVLVWKVDQWRNKASQLDEVKSALSSAIAKCEADKRITKEANDALQKSSDDISMRFASARVQFNSACMPVTNTSFTSSGRIKHAGGNDKGLRSEWLLGYSATCETYRSQRMILEKFIADERSSN